ncbi:16644_t:CDS:2, partial [Gigaspora margarita]
MCQLSLRDRPGIDYELARSWRKETKPASGPSVHIRQKSTRKRKSICYTEGSEEDHSSDSDYREKPKRKQEIIKRSRRKASDGMDKSIIVPFVETSEASQQSLTSSEISEDIITSREDTPWKGVYIEIKNLLQAKDRLILQETIHKKLDALFETDYTKIETKIISEPDINGDNQTEEA